MFKIIKIINVIEHGQYIYYLYIKLNLENKETDKNKIGSKSIRHIQKIIQSLIRNKLNLDLIEIS